MSCVLLTESSLPYMVPRKCWRCLPVLRNGETCTATLLQGLWRDHSWFHWPLQPGATCSTHSPHSWVKRNSVWRTWCLINFVGTHNCKFKYFVKGIVIVVGIKSNCIGERANWLLMNTPGFLIHQKWGFQAIYDHCQTDLAWYLWTTTSQKYLHSQWTRLVLQMLENGIGWIRASRATDSTKGVIT